MHTNNTIEKQVYRYIMQYELVHSGECVLAAVSGGADSVCLLLLLERLRERLGIRLEAVTVNHGIRGASAAADVKYVEKLCSSYEIPLHICEVSVPEFLHSHSMSEEEAARKLRYQCFAGIAAEIGAAAVAVAHHREDNCETVLHHLFRGSSLRGLKGMEPVKKISMQLRECGTAEADWEEEEADAEKPGSLRIIRPLLELSRQDIETWLEARQVSWQTDETNLTDDYTRNRLRHQIIPQITEQINVQAVPHILQAAKDICEAQELVEELAGSWLTEHAICRLSDRKNQKSENWNKADKSRMPAKWNKAGESRMPANWNKNDTEHSTVRIPEEIIIDIPKFRECRPIIQREILVQIGRKLTGAADFKDVGRVHLDMILALAEKETSKRLELPAGLRVRKEYETLIFSRKVRQEDKKLVSDRKTGQEHEILISDRKAEQKIENLIYETKSEQSKKQSDRSENSSCQIYIEGAETELVTVIDGIPAENYSFRTFLYKNDKKIPENSYTKWFDYDKIKNGLSLRTRRTGDYFLLDGGGRKKLKSYLIDRKVPAAKRNQLPMLAEGNHVLWLADGRISAAYKVTEKTRRVLEMQIIRQSGLS